MMENKTFLDSSSPHIRGKSTTKKIMLDVIIALSAPFYAGLWFFGFRALLVVFLAVASAYLSEVVFNLCCKKTLRQALDIDLTSIVTGFIIGLSLNANAAWYLPVMASVFAVVVVKMLFGGTGNNIVNPAIAGRGFIFISFIGSSASNMASNWTTTDGNVLAGATPLNDILNGIDPGITNLDLFLGTNVVGCIGETCKIAIIVGFLYLVVRRVIDFKYPLIYIAVTGLFTVALKGFDFSWFLPSILGGGLMFVAVFMATDYVTSPTTKLGNYIYFTALGLLTAGLRVACKMPIITFAVLLMNFLVPFIDKLVVPKPFGYRQPDKEEKA